MQRTSTTPLRRKQICHYLRTKLQMWLRKTKPVMNWKIASQLDILKLSFQWPPWRASRDQAIPGWDICCSKQLVSTIVVSVYVAQLQLSMAWTEWVSPNVFHPQDLSVQHFAFADTKAPQVLSKKWLVSFSTIEEERVFSQRKLGWEKNVESRKAVAPNWFRGSWFMCYWHHPTVLWTRMKLWCLREEGCASLGILFFFTFLPAEFFFISPCEDVDTAETLRLMFCL